MILCYQTKTKNMEEKEECSPLLPSNTGRANLEQNKSNHTKLWHQVIILESRYFIISEITVVEFHREAEKIHYIFASKWNFSNNFCLYLVKIFDWNHSKLGLVFIKPASLKGSLKLKMSCCSSYKILSWKLNQFLVP